MRGLKGTTAIVTGGASGIGKAICLRLAEEGVRIAIIDRDKVGADLTAEAIRRLGGEAHVETVDITDYAAVSASVARCEEKLSAPDILVNCAGGDSIRNFIDTDEAYRAQVIAVNLGGPMNVTHAVLPSMSKSGHGRVILISSEGGRIGSSGQATYSACKAGVIALAKTLAREYSKQGITVNSVAPGPTATPMMDAALNGGDGEAGQKILQSIIRGVPLGRIGEPDDVAGIVAFLASEEAGFITGQVISVSGGLTMIG